MQSFATETREMKPRMNTKLVQRPRNCRRLHLSTPYDYSMIPASWGWSPPYDRPSG
jgi:hypothetical protein